MWTLKIAVVLVSLWGDVYEIEVTLKDAYRSEAICEAYRVRHEIALAFAVAERGLLSSILPLRRVVTEGECIPPKPQFFPPSNIVVIPT